MTNFEWRNTSKYDCWNVAKIVFMWYQIFIWYQNIYLFNQNIFLFNEIYFPDIEIYIHSIKTNFNWSKLIKINSKGNIFIILLFDPIKIFLYYVSFLLDSFLVTIPGLPHLFAKVKFYFQYVSWKAARCCKKAAKKDSEY